MNVTSALSIDAIRLARLLCGASVCSMGWRPSIQGWLINPWGAMTIVCVLGMVGIALNGLFIMPAAHEELDATGCLASLCERFIGMARQVSVTTIASFASLVFVGRVFVVTARCGHSSRCWESGVFGTVPCACSQFAADKNAIDERGIDRIKPMYATLKVSRKS